MIDRCIELKELSRAVLTACRRADQLEHSLRPQPLRKRAYQLLEGADHDSNTVVDEAIWRVLITEDIAVDWVYHRYAGFHAPMPKRHLNQWRVAHSLVNNAWLQASFETTNLIRYRTTVSRSLNNLIENLYYLPKSVTDPVKTGLESLITEIDEELSKRPPQLS